MSFNSKYKGQEVEDLLDKISRMPEGSSSAGGAYALQEHGSDDTIFTLTPNTFHVWGEVESLELSLGEEQEGVANEYLFQFETKLSGTALTLPHNLAWANGTEPEIKNYRIYQVSILNGLATAMEFKREAVISEFTIYIYEGMFWTEMNSYTETYEFEVGMTWGEWVNSEYNTNGYYKIDKYDDSIYNDNVGETSSGYTAVINSSTGIPVYSDDFINDGEYYSIE